MKSLIRKILHESDDLDWMMDTSPFDPSSGNYVIIFDKNDSLDHKIDTLKGLYSIGYEDYSGYYSELDHICYIYLNDFKNDDTGRYVIDRDSCLNYIVNNDYFKDYTPISYRDII